MGSPVTARQRQLRGSGTWGAQRSARTPKWQAQLEGIQLLVGIVAVMWIVEVVNALDANRLDSDGIWPRNIGRLWGIFTAPFLHAGFGHLIANTVPLVFMGLIIALRGAAKLALVTAIVIVVGGLGTWLLAPSNYVTVGASGVVFGYATYLFTRGIFNRRLLELLIGLAVALVWGGVLLASLVPGGDVSWQGHLCGAAGGVVAAWLLSSRRRERLRAGVGGGAGVAGLAK